MSIFSALTDNIPLSKTTIGRGSSHTINLVLVDLVTLVSSYSTSHTKSIYLTNFGDK